MPEPAPARQLLGAGPPAPTYPAARTWVQGHRPVYPSPLGSRTRSIPLAQNLDLWVSLLSTTNASFKLLRCVTLVACDSDLLACFSSPERPCQSSQPGRLCRGRGSWEFRGGNKNQGSDLSTQPFAGPARGWGRGAPAARPPSPGPSAQLALHLPMGPLPPGEKETSNRARFSPPPQPP